MRARCLVPERPRYCHAKKNTFPVGRDPGAICCRFDVLSVGDFARILQLRHAAGLDQGSTVVVGVGREEPQRDRVGGRDGVVAVDADGGGDGLPELVADDARRNLRPVPRARPDRGAGRESGPGRGHLVRRAGDVL